MTIYESIKSMKNEVKALSSMMTRQGWCVEIVGDWAVRVINTDGITFQYSVTNGNKTFHTRNQNIFCNVLEWALS